MNGAGSSAVESLQQIYAIVLALSLAEAFKQFVVDEVEGKSRIHWDRLWALAAFLLLLIPFYHGMARYLYEVYRAKTPPNHYGGFLLIDTVAFTIEASLFFVMSRALPNERWHQFYTAVVYILIVDSVWAFIVWLAHTPCIVNWLVLNLIFIPTILAIRYRWGDSDKCGPKIALLALLIRAIADYWTSWSFYFPPSA